jgi:hypothetical protein
MAVTQGSMKLVKIIERIDSHRNHGTTLFFNFGGYPIVNGIMGHCRAENDMPESIWKYCENVYNT